MCIRVYIPRIMAVWVGTAIVPCCLFDMQRSAVEQLHGPPLKYFTPHITQSGSGSIRMSSKSEVAPSR